jgi:hypothetical protein
LSAFAAPLGESDFPWNSSDFCERGKRAWKTSDYEKAGSIPIRSRRGKPTLRKL